MPAPRDAASAADHRRMSCSKKPLSADELMWRASQRRTAHAAPWAGTAARQGQQDSASTVPWPSSGQQGRCRFAAGTRARLGGQRARAASRWSSPAPVTGTDARAPCGTASPPPGSGRGWWAGLVRPDAQFSAQEGEALEAVRAGRGAGRPSARQTHAGAGPGVLGMPPPSFPASRRPYPRHAGAHHAAPPHGTSAVVILDIQMPGPTLMMTFIGDP